MDPILKRLLELALEEDIGSGDITTLAVVDEGATARARVIARSRLVFSGALPFAAVFELLDSRVEVTRLINEGDEASEDDVLFRLSGPARAILMGERVALNILARLSGVATLTRRFVDAVEGLDVRIIDTRKTTPGLRALEKAAVRHGRGHNHRFGLYDGILLKENHLKAAGGIGPAVKLARERARHTVKVEVEVTSLAELSEALDAGADAILLDNMEPGELAEAVSLASGRALLEASGGISLDNVRRVAETGVDLISIGALTHSAPSADVSLIFV